MPETGEDDAGRIDPFVGRIADHSRIGNVQFAPGRRPGQMEHLLLRLRRSQLAAIFLPEQQTIHRQAMKIQVDARVRRQGDPDRSAEGVIFRRKGDREVVFGGILFPGHGLGAGNRQDRQQDKRKQGERGGDKRHGSLLERGWVWPGMPAVGGSLILDWNY